MEKNNPSREIILKFKNAEEVDKLHLALCEAKFNEHPYRYDIQGNPIVAEISNRVYDLCISLQRTKKDREGWESFRNLDRMHRVYRYIRRTAKEVKKDQSLNIEQKIKFMRDFIAPFYLSDDELRDFIETGELKE